MKTTTERAAEALDLLPEDMREPAVAYLIEQAEKFRALKEQIAAGMEDIAAGRVSEWKPRRIPTSNAAPRTQIVA
jgi:predicted transcriptional regulator